MARRTLIKIVTFLGGIYFFLEFILPGQFLGIDTAQYDQDISNGFITIGVMAIGLGIINIFMIHGSKIVYRRKGWGNSIALIAGLALMLAVTTLNWRRDDRTSAEAEQVFILRDFANRIQSDATAKVGNVLLPGARNRKLLESAIPKIDELEAQITTAKLPYDALQVDKDLFESERAELQHSLAAARAALATLSTSDEVSPEGLAANSVVAKALGDLGSAELEFLSIQSRYSIEKKMYDFLYIGLFTSLGAAMFSLLGFYIASAAYRAFRIRSGESALMMIAAIVVMLGQIPFGLWIWSGFPEVRSWLLTTPSAAAFRAIKIGAGVAALAMAYRMWFSIESEEFTEKK